MSEYDKFQYEMMTTVELAAIAVALKVEIQDYLRVLKIKTHSEENRKTWLAEKRAITRKRNYIVKILASRQMKLPMF